MLADAGSTITVDSATADRVVGSYDATLLGFMDAWGVFDFSFTALALAPADSYEPNDTTADADFNGTISVDGTRYMARSAG